MEVDQSEHTPCIKIEGTDLDASTELDMSTEMNVSTDFNVSTETNTSTGSELNTSVFAESRLTISMMEIIKSEEKDTELSSSITQSSRANPRDQSACTDEIVSPVTCDIKKEGPYSLNTGAVGENATVDPKTENDTIPTKTENDVMNTIQDILRISSAAFNIKTGEIKEDSKTANVDANVSKPPKEIESVMSEMIDTVTSLVVPEKVKSQSMHSKRSCEVLTLHVDSKTTESLEVAKEIDTGVDKKEVDEEADIAYSPYIENVDSPVYPVITTSNLTCVDTDSNYQVGATSDFPISVDITSQSVGVVDSTLRDVAKTMEHLVSEVTLNSEAVSFETRNLQLFSAGLCVIKLDPCVTEVGSDLNKSVEEVTNNISVDG